MTYFITFHTYGTWLHGHDEGSVDDEHNQFDTPRLPPSPPRMSNEQALMKNRAIKLNAEHRFVVDATIREVCNYRNWKLHALSVRSTHVHVVVSAKHTPERVMNDLKAYCTRRMREARILDAATEPWSHHGSTRYVDTDNSFARAKAYVNDEQGEPLEMTAPLGWRR